jgi:predicted RNA binding protein YcfA (HicA-like mRNA interferase family)
VRRVTWKELEKVCKLAGWVRARIAGDHLIMTRDGMARPIVIKMASNLGDDIVQSNKRTLRLSSQQFEELLDQVQKKKKPQKKKPKGQT